VRRTPCSAKVSTNPVADSVLLSQMIKPTNSAEMESCSLVLLLLVCQGLDPNLGFHPHDGSFPLFSSAPDSHQIRLAKEFRKMLFEIFEGNMRPRNQKMLCCLAVSIYKTRKPSLTGLSCKG